MEQNRMKSPVFWGGVAALIINFLVAVDVINVAQSEAVKLAINAILTAIAAFAVGNNPTSKTTF